MVLYLLLFTLLAGQNGVFCKGNHSEGLSLRDSPSEVPAIALSIIPASNKTAHVTGSPQFELARCKGQQLLDTIALNTYRISDHQSTFEMSTDGWNVNKKSYDQDVQISNDFSLWYQMGIDMRNFVIYEAANPHTKSYFKEFFNLEACLFVAMENFSKKPENSWKLWRYSDVVHILWKHHCQQSNRPTSSLRAMLRATISNEQSVDIIEEVQERLHIIPNPSYPGYRFSMDSAEGLALLGTPNGKGMGWLLIEHRDDYAGKTVLAVDLFYSNPHQPSLIF